MMKFLFQLFLLASSHLLALSVSDEGATLLRIKASFRDIDNALSDWSEALSSHHCTWRGVSCDNATFNVVALNLSSLNLNGKISSSIGNLKNLKSIDLRGNNLSGQIPDEIGDCVSLNTLDVSLNNIIGDIPYSLSKLKHLETLILKNNQLSGPIPSTLSQIPNLKILDLAINQLTGEIPRLLYWNQVLQYLGLRSNKLSGEISPDICQLSGLWYFDARNNTLTGSIPDNIGNCTSFQVLDLSYNRLSGKIPFNIGFLQVATLSLQGNWFSGEIPYVIGLMQALAVLDLSCNNFSGGIPPIFGNLTYTEKLYLHGNSLSGPIPPELGNMSTLHYMELNDNKLSGFIPQELGKLTDLFDLNLANNQLEGRIPDNLSACKNLNSFNAYGNKLNGTIPSSFEKLKSMTYLNLSFNAISGHIPIQLSRIGNLDTLDISGNQISGPIPPNIGDLEHLLNLNLSRNQFTGSIPSDFGNFRSVMEIDISFNHLSGPIPEELSQLQTLTLLNLQYNNLTGGVTPLVGCPSLAVLNVSYNSLSGVIPTADNFSRFHPDSFVGNANLCSNCRAPRATSRLALSTAIILGVTLGILITLLSAFFLYRPRRPPPPMVKPLRKPPPYSSPKLVILDMNMALHVYEDIMRMTENLSDKYIIGRGASSTVYKCVLKNCRPVAVKRLHSHDLHYAKEFETELATIGSVKHRNLVALQAFSLSSSGHLLFYDYMDNGSLYDILHGSSKRGKLHWETRVKIAYGAALGLSYLHHDCTPRIVHRDVKSSNILLDKDWEPHLTDFGIARNLCVSKPHTSTYVMGTIGYIDPEYARTSRLTEKSDVYSYGIVLLELLTRRKAVDEECNLHQLILSKTVNNTVMETVDQELVDTCADLGAVKKLFQLAILCTKKQPGERPTMHEVTRVLECLLPAGAVPIKGAATMASSPGYVEEYVNLKDGRVINCPSVSTSDAQLFLKFGEVISQSTP